MNRTRPYRMDARAAAAEVTRERIAAAAEQAFVSQAYDDVTIRGVAGEAGVSLQTVLNHFATKEDLLHAGIKRFTESINRRRWSVTPGDVDAAVSVLVDDYDLTGDATMRWLAVEDRIEMLQPWLAEGRAEHEKWVIGIFPDALAGLTGAERKRRIALLVVATDVYAWKLLRRDRAMSRAETVAGIRELVLALHP